jgi:hypothetical protein
MKNVAVRHRHGDNGKNITGNPEIVTHDGYRTSAPINLF